MVNLCWPCHKIGQDHPKVKIYINFIELLFLRRHAKFQNHKLSGSGEEDSLKIFLLFIAMAVIFGL